MPSPGAHALHDGYTDLIYVLLPLWQAEFGLGYGMLAALRGHYAGIMAALQLPAGWLAAAMVLLLMPRMARAEPSEPRRTRAGRGRGGFWLLFVIGVLDTGVRMGLLTFLPFLLQKKGASLPTLGVALALVFLGGAAGKFACGWIGARGGILLTVLVTEGGTAACILGVLVLPLLPIFVLLPALAVMLNGTSSMLYGTVPGT